MQPLGGEIRLNKASKEKGERTDTEEAAKADTRERPRQSPTNMQRQISFLGCGGEGETFLFEDREWSWKELIATY